MHGDRNVGRVTNQSQQLRVNNRSSSTVPLTCPYARRVLVELKALFRTYCNGKGQLFRVHFRECVVNKVRNDLIATQEAVGPHAQPRLQSVMSQQPVV